MQQKKRFGNALIVLSIVLVLAGNLTAQELAKRIYIQATAMGTSTQLGRVVDVKIIINEWSTADDQKILLDAFREDGSQGLAAAVEKMGAKGRISITGTIGFDLNYIRLFKMPDGSQRVRFVTDRPIRWGELYGSTRSMDYNLSMGEVNIPKDKDKATGTLIPAGQFKLDKEKELTLEAFQNPWKLTNIRISD